MCGRAADVAVEYGAISLGSNFGLSGKARETRGRPKDYKAMAVEESCKRSALHY